MKEIWRTIVIVALVASAVLGPFVVFLLSELDNVTYIGEVAELKMRAVEDKTYEEHFLVTVRMDSGDVRTFRIKSKDSYIFYDLKLGSRYAFTVKLVEEVTSDYCGFVKHYNLQERTNSPIESVG